MIGRTRDDSSRRNRSAPRPLRCPTFTKSRFLHPNRWHTPSWLRPV